MEIQITRGEMKVSKTLTSGLVLAVAILPYELTAATFLEEIVVTATKREASAQDLPISLTAISGDNLRALGITHAQDIDDVVPNFDYVSSFGKTTPNITIRGVGFLGFFSSGVSPVGVYSDNVYIGQNIAQGFALFDLERIEVLRGPQGTLFGRNTTGGLINFISVKPVVGEELTGFIYQSAGEENSFETEGAISVPLGDKAATRFSFERNVSDGFFKNVNPAVNEDDSGEIEMYSARAQLLWEPTESFNILLNGHYGSADNKAPRQASYVDQAELFLIPDRNFNGVTDPGDVIVNCPPGTRSGFFQGGCSDPFRGVLTEDDDPYTTQMSVPTHEDIDLYSVSMTMTREMSDGT